MPTDTDEYGFKHESVDLGKGLGQPQVSANGRDIADATSQSPLAQMRGGADPVNIGPGSVKTK
jgi:hypothetical protein